MPVSPLPTGAADGQEQASQVVGMSWNRKVFVISHGLSIPDADVPVCRRLCEAQAVAKRMLRQRVGERWRPATHQALDSVDLQRSLQFYASVKPFGPYCQARRVLSWPRAYLGVTLQGGKLGNWLNLAWHPNACLQQQSFTRNECH